MTGVPTRSESPRRRPQKAGTRGPAATRVRTRRRPTGRLPSRHARHLVAPRHATSGRDPPGLREEELCHQERQHRARPCPWTLLRTARRHRQSCSPKLQGARAPHLSGGAMAFRRGGCGSVRWPGPGGGSVCPGPLGVLRASLLLASVLWGARGTASASLSTAVGRAAPLTGRRYLSIGDGSVTEFEFPEESEGIIVVSSQYPGQGNGTGPGPVLRVTSLDTEVLAVKNVSATAWAGGGGFVVSIHSGLPGLAPLHLQLLEPREAPPALLEERRDFCIKVARAEDTPATLGTDLAHFSESPVLYLLLPLIFVNKCSFGCKVELEVLKGLLQSPQPMLLGLLGQFLVMPFCAFLMAKVFMLPKALALGLIITCSSPGGGGSYLFSLLLGGDVTLAISMTFISTVAATGFLPLSSAIYSRLLSIHETLHVPISKVLGTLLFIAIPIAAGVVIKSKLPKFSQLLLQVIKPFSFVLLLGGLFLAYHMGVFILAGVRLPIVLVGLTVPPVGLLVGYCLATCLKLPVAQRRTVSIEVGVQNSLLALAVLQLSLRRLQADYASQAPFLVALSGTSEMLALVTGHFIYSSVCAVP
ncbi:P3 protein isoform X1 [Physeter macrocephalus]|uniref:P3 protein n=2 Tax=Physeter macrocephalus TaxID=9755 RepID=A0A2Y9S1P1_PHYMC|nr:P3 protein isoform X1 [Physeter catodon]XP_028338522.1 P3 protein isoform X1 [Physeter catodon]XP_028338523.1 P3 protein isoform X1 [Physeter catodon]|eukprot:XP_023972516.1 P3 protein isoform X1 [Physeter catodon]